MTDFVSTSVFIIFLVCPIVLLALFAHLYRFKREIKRARKIYTVELTAKCVELEERIVTRSSYERYYGHNFKTHSKNIRVFQPTYSADYAGHSRCFFKRDLNYNTDAAVGEFYTIYLNPADNKYRDFVDDFYYKDREQLIRKYKMAIDITLLVVVVAILIFAFMI